MSKTEIIALLLSSAAVSGAITTILTYFFDIRKNKNSRIFQLKQEAYMKAVDSISGASETIFDYIIKKHSIKKISPIDIIEFNAAYTRKLAPAMLVANSEIKDLLNQISSLIFECSEIVEVLTTTAQRTKGGRISDLNSPEVKRLKDWNRKMQTLENKALAAMQKDLGLKN